MKTNYESGTCNTICEVTGFKVKLSETILRWDGVRCIGKAWHPRQPQDYPPVILETKVYPESRSESDVTDAVLPFTPI